MDNKPSYRIGNVVSGESTIDAKVLGVANLSNTYGMPSEDRTFCLLNSVDCTCNTISTPKNKSKPKERESCYCVDYKPKCDCVDYSCKTDGFPTNVEVDCMYNGDTWSP